MKRYSGAVPVLVITFLLAVAIPLESLAQTFGRVGEQVAAGTSYHVFTRPGEATVQVLVAGVQGSGIYEVGVDTDLGALLALTGGLAISPREGRSLRKVTVRLLREESGRRHVVYEAPLEQMLLEPGNYPVLRDGDVLSVETVERTRFGWRDVFTVATGLVSISWAAVQVVRAFQ